MRTPESSVALACLARLQLSDLAFATRSSSALRLAVSASAAFFFFSSNRQIGSGADQLIRDHVYRKYLGEMPLGSSFLIHNPNKVFR